MTSSPGNQPLNHMNAPIRRQRTAMGLATAAEEGAVLDDEPRSPPPAGLLTTTPEDTEEGAGMRPASPGDVALLQRDNDSDNYSNTPMIVLPEFTSQKSSGLAPVIKRRSVREACMISTWQEVEVAPFTDPVTGKQVTLVYHILLNWLLGSWQDIKLLRLLAMLCSSMLAPASCVLPCRVLTPLVTAAAAASSGHHPQDPDRALDGRAQREADRHAGPGEAGKGKRHQA